MKKLLMMLFGAILATDAMSQAGVAGYQVDSMYSVVNDVRTMKVEYEYNELGLVTAEYSYSYMVDGQFVSTPVPVGKNLYFYNEKGKPTRSESYDYEDGKWVMSSRMEYTDYNEENGQPCVSISYEQDKENPSEEMQPTTKIIVHKFHNFCDEDEDVYEYQNGEWVLTMTNHYEFDEWDNKVRAIAEILFEGEVAGSMEMTWAYDSHHNTTQSTTNVSMMGMNMTTTTTYTNEYDANGCLVSQVQNSDEQGTMTTYYCWSAVSLTGIKEIKNEELRMKNIADAMYDLSGRRVANSQSSIYIMNGKKFFRK